MCIIIFRVTVTDDTPESTESGQQSNSEQSRQNSSQQGTPSDEV